MCLRVTMRKRKRDKRTDGRRHIEISRSEREIINGCTVLGLDVRNWNWVYSVEYGCE